MGLKADKIEAETACDPIRLGVLASHRSEKVRALVAKNTCSPKEALVSLVREFPGEVFKNAAASLFELENKAEPLAWIPLGTRLSLANDEQTPEEVLVKLASDLSVEVRQSVAKNTNTNRATLDQLASDKSVMVLMNVGGNPRTSVASLQDLAAKNYAVVTIRVASNPNISLSLLRQLAAHPSNIVRGEAASNPKATLAILETLAADNEQSVVRIAKEKLESLKAIMAQASDVGTSEDKLAAFSVSEQEDVRRAVAANVAAPKRALVWLFEEFPKIVLDNPASELFAMETEDWIPVEMKKRVALKTRDFDILSRLAMDQNFAVRSHAAANEVVPLSKEATALLAHLARDENDWVREVVASNARTPVVSLVELSKDASNDVRRRVVNNSSLPEEHVRSMESDSSWHVAAAARKRSRA